MLRVRMNKHVFRQLQEFAVREADRKQEFVSVSDLVRWAINEYLSGSLEMERLSSLRPPRAEASP